MRKKKLKSEEEELSSLYPISMFFLRSLGLMGRIAMPPLTDFESSYTSKPFDLQTIEALLNKHKVAGVSIACIQNKEIVWAKGYGYADKKIKTPLTAQTVLQAGSISKSIAAFGILSLVEKGQLDLDIDIGTYIQNWRLPTAFPQTQITLRHILTHTAGINVGRFKGYRKNRKLPSTLSILEGRKPANSPSIRAVHPAGRDYSYSGGGYMLAQQLVEEITGIAFDEYVRQEIFEPLGMSSCSFTYPIPNLSISNGYNLSGSKVPGNWRVYPEMAAAGLWSTPTDLAKFLVEVQASLVGNANKILTQTNTKEYVDTELGIDLQKKRGRKMMGFSGRNKGFVSQMVASPTDGTGMVVMTNSDNGGPLIKDVYGIV